MESWSYVSGERGFASEESVTASDVIARGKNGSMDWELKSPFYSSNMGSSSQDAIENMGFLDLGFQETMRKSLPNCSNSIRDALGSKLGGVRLFNPLTENSFWGEEDSSSKLSSSVVEYNCRDSALIDLKLGRFSDQRDAQKFSSTESSISAKRVRIGGLNSLTPYCQVHGCKKDLSSCKDYHKRHKVCEVHSKTPKVIVNGIEQRFCQQCSRFHLLAEFDDGKRSCRKRLAGHNERRRKPHVGIHSGRTGRLYQSYNGSRFNGTAVTTSSFIRQDVLPGSLPHQQKYDTNDWCRHIKLEEGADYSSQSAITVANGELHPKSPFSAYGFEKHCPPLYKIGVHAVSGNKFNGNSSRYLFQNTSQGGEDFTGFNSSLTVQALSGLSDSGRALSLLSSQSQTSSSHNSGILMAYPLIIPGNHEHYSVTQVSEKLLGMIPQASKNTLSNKFNSSGLNSVESHFNPILNTSGSDAVDFGIDGMFHGSEYMNAKDRLSCEDGPTIDLLQLSSQLQRVEHQRQSSLQVKPGNDSFCSLRIT